MLPPPPSCPVTGVWLALSVPSGVGWAPPHWLHPPARGPESDGGVRGWGKRGVRRSLCSDPALPLSRVLTLLRSRRGACWPPSRLSAAGLSLPRPHTGHPVGLSGAVGPHPSCGCFPGSGMWLGKRDPMSLLLGGESREQRNTSHVRSDESQAEKQSGVGERKSGPIQRGGRGAGWGGGLE